MKGYERLQKMLEEAAEMGKITEETKGRLLEDARNNPEKMNWHIEGARMFTDEF